jgi:hypothetical protein
MWPGCDWRDGSLADAVVHYREAHGYTEEDLISLAAVAAWTAEEWNDADG